MESATEGVSSVEDSLHEIEDLQLSRTSVDRDYLNGIINQEDVLRLLEEPPQASTLKPPPPQRQPLALPDNYPELMQEITNSTVEKIPFQTLKVGRLLGQGYTWKVYEGSHIGHEKPTVALKFLRVGHSDDDMDAIQSRLAAARSEIRILSHRVIRSNERIVTLHAISFQQHFLSPVGKAIYLPVLVEELAMLNAHGQPYTLQQQIDDVQWHLSPMAQLNLLLDVAKGLVDLHDLNIVHGDLKPSNILLFLRIAQHPVAKISDFGFCEALDDANPARGTTAYWAGPELLHNAKSDLIPFRSSIYRDLYSFGLLIWFVLFVQLPFGNEDDADLEELARIKNQESLKDQIDRLTSTRYRLRFGDLVGEPAIRAIKREIMFHFDENDWRSMGVSMENFRRAVKHRLISEEVRDRAGEWVNSGSGFQWEIPLLSLFASYFLVRQPPLRTGLRFFIEMCDPEWVLQVPNPSWESGVRTGALFRDLVMANFLGRQQNDFLWSEFFCPARRQLLMTDFENQLFRSSRYRLMIKLCLVRLKREIDILRSERKQTMSFHTHVPLSFEADKFETIPREVPSLIVQCLLNRTQWMTNQSGSPTFMLLGSCYLRGFGIAASKLEARRYFSKAAALGLLVAKGTLLLAYGAQELLDVASIEQQAGWYMDYFIGNGGGESEKDLLDSEPRFYDGLEELRRVITLSADEELLQTLSLALKRFLQPERRFAWQRPTYESRMNQKWGSLVFPSGEADLWASTRSALEKQQLSRLRNIFFLVPQLLEQQEGQPSILHYAALYGYHSVTRMLINEYKMDPSVIDDIGLSPIAIAACSPEDITSSMLTMVTRTRVSLKGLDIPLLLMLNSYAGPSNAITWTALLARIKYMRSVPAQQMGEEENLHSRRDTDFLENSLTSTAVIWSIWADNAQALRTLLSLSPNINRRFKDIHYLGALHCAAERMKPLLVGLLLAAGARTSLTASQGRSPLHLACSSYQASRILHGELCDTSQRNVASQGASSMCPYHEPPHFPARWTLALLEEEPSVEEIRLAQKLVVRLLLCYGADVNAGDVSGRTPLAYSLGTQAYHIAELLLNADPPADINRTSRFGMTPLHEACSWFRRLNQVEFCLKEGADVDLKDALGQTALHLAARQGNLEICRALVLAGADIGSIDAQKNNCLRLAQASRNEKLVSYFLDVIQAYGAEAVAAIFETFDDEGLNAVTLAIWPGLNCSSALRSRLIRLAALSGTVNLQNASGYTALHLAVSFADTDLVNELIDHGADASIKDTIFGWTAVHLAAMEPWRRSIDLLKTFMDRHQYVEPPDDLMGWTTGSLIFWLQSTTYLVGLPPEYYTKGEQYRRFVARAVAAFQAESERRKGGKATPTFWDITARHLERTGLLRWKPWLRPIERPPLDAFSGGDPSTLEHLIKDHDTECKDQVSDRRIVLRSWDPYLAWTGGEIVRIFDLPGRHRANTLLHLMQSRRWRVWTADRNGIIRISHPHTDMR